MMNEDPEIPLIDIILTFFRPTSTVLISFLSFSTILLLLLVSVFLDVKLNGFGTVTLGLVVWLETGCVTGLYKRIFIRIFLRNFP